MDTVYLLVNQAPQNSLNNKTGNVLKMNWTSDIEKDLIKLVKKEKGLWEIDNELYKRRNWKYITWNKIAKKMKALWPNYEHLFTSSSALIKKIANLKKYYVSEEKKVGSLTNYVSQWCHFQDLAFLKGNTETKQENLQISHDTPIVIKFPDGKRKSLKNVVKENLKISSMEEETNIMTTEDGLCDQDNNNETSISIAESFSLLEEPSSKPKKKRTPLTAQSVSVGPDFFSKALKHQTTKMTHDEAFANFIAQDLGKIPEGKQKEQLRFKLVELIHQCKMDTTYLYD